jgi:hypothetical protein
MAFKYSLKKQIKADSSTGSNFRVFIIFAILSIGTIFGGTRLVGLIFQFEPSQLSRIKALAQGSDVTELVFISVFLKVIDWTALIFGVLSIIGLLLCIFKIHTGKYLVNNGMEIDAEIVFAAYQLATGRIEYTYKVEDKEFKKDVSMYVTTTAEKYNQGDRIKILVDRNNYKKVIIKDHFTILE